MEWEKVSEVIHNAEPQAVRMAKNGASTIDIQISRGWKIEKMWEDTRENNIIYYYEEAHIVKKQITFWFKMRISAKIEGEQAAFLSSFFS